HAGSFVTTLAAVTFRRIYVTWHSLTSSLGLNFPNSDCTKFEFTISRDSRPGSRPLEASAFEEQTFTLLTIWTTEPQCLGADALPAADTSG
ncbi:MAG: hypothetical protein WCZ86_12090, partial [Desulfurivibrionaceae bacterium]